MKRFVSERKSLILLSFLLAFTILSSIYVIHPSQRNINQAAEYQQLVATLKQYRLDVPKKHRNFSNFCEYLDRHGLSEFSEMITNDRDESKKYFIDVNSGDVRLNKD